MKTLLTIIIILAVSLRVSAQTTKNAYSDYKPCTECFEQWKVTEGQSDNTSSGVILPTNREGRQRKPFRDTYVGQELGNSVRVIVGTTLLIFTAIILNKASKPSIQ